MDPLPDVAYDRRTGPPDRHPARGLSYVETLVVVGLLALSAGVGFPWVKAYYVENSLLAAGRSFRTEFFKTRLAAVRTGVYTAIRFEQEDDGTYYAVYADRNDNGVRSADIAAGIDERLDGPHRLTAGVAGVRVGFNPGVRSPDGEILTGDPIRFGRSGILSFSPDGTATPGTFYLAGENVQAAVRVTPGTARVRLMTCRGSGKTCRWIVR
jgi:hypothetical protein